MPALSFRQASVKAWVLSRCTTLGLSMINLARWMPGRFSVLVLLTMFVLPLSAHAAPPANVEIQPALPLLFERNIGQFPPGYDFVVRNKGGKVGLGAEGITFAREPGEVTPPLRILFGVVSSGIAAYTKSPIPTKTH